MNHKKKKKREREDDWIPGKVLEDQVDWIEDHVDCWCFQKIESMPLMDEEDRDAECKVANGAIHYSVLTIEFEYSLLSCFATFV